MFRIACGHPGFHMADMLALVTMIFIYYTRPDRAATASYLNFIG